MLLFTGRRVQCLLVEELSRYTQYADAEPLFYSYTIWQFWLRKLRTLPLRTIVSYNSKLYIKIIYVSKTPINETIYLGFRFFYPSFRCYIQPALEPTLLSFSSSKKAFLEVSCCVTWILWGFSSLRKTGCASNPSYGMKGAC